MSSFDEFHAYTGAYNNYKRPLIQKVYLNSCLRKRLHLANYNNNVTSNDNSSPFQQSKLHIGIPFYNISDKHSFTVAILTRFWWNFAIGLGLVWNQKSKIEFVRGQNAITSSPILPQFFTPVMHFHFQWEFPNKWVTTRRPVVAFNSSNDASRRSLYWAGKLKKIV